MFDLAAIGERLRTQDNRITAHPIFEVQEQKREYGYDPYWRSDGIAWIDDDGDEAGPQKHQRLEEKYSATGKEPEGWRRTAYVERWEYVQPFFTEAGAQLYIEREYLMSLPAPRRADVRKCIEDADEALDGLLPPREGIRIKRIHFEEPTLEVDFEFPAFQALIAEAAQIFRDGGASNVFEFQATPPDMEPLIVTIQRKYGKTPMQLLAEARAEAPEGDPR